MKFFLKKQLHPCRTWQTSKSTAGASKFANYQCVSDFSLAIIKGYNNIGDINLDIPHRYLQHCYRMSRASAHFAARLKFSVMVCGTRLASRHFISCSWFVSTANISTVIALQHLDAENPSRYQRPEAQCLAPFSNMEKKIKTSAGCESWSVEVE